jgi:two-component sensor histidine kinase
LKLKNEDLFNLNKQLEQANTEKTILLKEIHHRVKNNLQLVMSLLNIQAQDTQNVSIQDFLEKGQSRIATMSLIHQNLYQTENFANINFQDYLEHLITNIKHTFNENNIDYVIKTNQNNFDLDTAIPLGLIINELVCNALKHAFPSNLKGRIEIEINKTADCTYELQIGDNGVGVLSSDQNSKSIGLELVSLLVMQLKGKIQKLDKTGTNYKIIFNDSFSAIIN